MAQTTRVGGLTALGITTSASSIGSSDMAAVAADSPLAQAVARATASFQRETKEKWTFLLGLGAGVVALGLYAWFQRHQKQIEEKEGKLSREDNDKLSKELLEETNLDGVSAVRSSLPDLRDLNEQGNKAFARKAYQEALELYTLALQQRATITSLDSAVVLCNRATTHIAMGRFQYAFADAFRSCNVTRNCWPKALWVLGIALERLEDYENGIRCLNRGAQLTDGAVNQRFEQFLKRMNKAAAKEPSKDGSSDGVSALHLCPPPEIAPPMPLSSNQAYYQRLIKGSYPIEIRETEGRGRGLYATRRIAEGALLWIENPVASVTLHPNSCEFCSRPLGRQPVVCPNSKVQYCSAECQARAWQSYQKVLGPQMDKIKTLMEEADEADSYVAVKIPLLGCKVVAAAMQSDTWPSTPSQALGFSHLSPRHERLPPYTSRDYSFAHVHGLYLRMIAALGMSTDDSSFVDALWFDNFAAIVAGNGLGVPASAQTGVADHHLLGPGLALYRVAPMFQHSCKPNAELILDPENSGHVLSVRATRRIFKNEQLTVCYINPGLPLDARAKLLETLGIVCTCPRCLEEMSDQRSPSPQSRSPRSSPTPSTATSDARPRRGKRN